jgi:hypothetical protein
MSVAKHTLAAFALLAALAVPSASRAEGESRFSGIAQLDLTNAYYFRGILNENHGFIAQPWGEVYANLYSSEDGFVRDVTLGAGVWLSIHSKKTLALNDPHSIYEADYYPLVSIDLAGGFNLLTTYYFYDSPNGAWDEAVQELNFKLSYDDSESTKLSPWINIAVETFSSSSGNTSGTGIQFGVAPTFYENDIFSLSGSAEIGVTTGHYYDVPGYDGDESGFGYANLGLGVGVPLGDVLAANLGFKYFFFGDETQFANGGHDGHGVVVGSISASF